MTSTARILTVFLAASLAAFAWGRGAWAADPLQVFIDARDPAFVVVQGVAADTPAAARREMEGYAALEGVALVPWEAFRLNAQAYLSPHILKDEYPGASLVLSVVALVQTHPGRSFAVTWNGGLAVSFMDYQHAVSTYRDYLEDAEAYEQGRPDDSRADPLNPVNSLPDLLAR